MQNINGQISTGQKVQFLMRAHWAGGIIDCLEFDRSLRILDCVDELAFLALECDRLDAAWVGEQILALYCQATQDTPPDRLIQFYKAYRACLRAKLAIWHVQEPGQFTAADWLARARLYLQLAEKYLL